MKPKREGGWPNGVNSSNSDVIVLSNNDVICHFGSIHLRAEIAFQAEISGLEFWPVFQAEISGLIFSGQNFRPKFHARIPCQNFKPENSMPKYHDKSGFSRFLNQIQS